MHKLGISILAFGALLVTGWQAGSSEKISLKDECFKTLRVLTNALIDMQISDPSSLDFWAIRCDFCHVYHTRAAEAVYPFAVVYEQTGDKKYLSAAVRLGNWLIRQQLPASEWKETPEEWTGTTADQLLMMAAAFPIIADELKEPERDVWRDSI